MAFPSSVMNYIHATPDYQAFARRIALDPDGEVESLRKLYNSRVLGQYNPNIARFAFNFSQLITEATMGSGLDPKVWKAFTRPGGLTDFYHDIIMEDGFLDQTPELIIIPFNGLSNIARVCNDDNIMDVGDKLLERVPVVWDILWEHRDAIIQNRGSSVRMVERSPPEVVVRMLRQYRVLYLVRNRSFERMGLKFMHLSLFCYFHLPGSKLALDALSCSSMEVNHGEPQHRDIQRFAAYVQEVAAVLGTEAIFRRLKKDIANPKLPFFRDILSAISITSQILPDLEVRPFFGRLNMTKAVLDACMRELQTAERKLHPTVWYIGVDYIKVFFSKHDYNMIWGDDLMCRGDDVASILAQATKVCAVANPTTEWRRQTADVIAKLCFELAKDFRSKPGDRFIVSLGQGLSLRWYPVLKPLRDARFSPTADSVIDDLVRAWVTLGMVMNLNEVEERDQYEKDRAKFCSWSDCPFNIMRSPGSLHVCRGCGEVRYCGRECQIKDWKEDGHKWKCKRLKAA